MTRASELLKKLNEVNASTPVPQPIGTQNRDDLVPNPNDARGMSQQMHIEDQEPLAKKIGAIVDSLNDDDIDENIADIVEGYLEDVDQSGDMTVADAAMMLPLPDCQALYSELKTYLDKKGISYSEDTTDAMGLPSEVPLDLYPSSAGMIMGGVANAPSGMFNL